MKIHSSSALLSGDISVPGSKSHTIRACMLAALAEGTSFIRNPLNSADCFAAVEAIRQLGAKVQIENNLWTVTASAASRHLPADVVNVANSGSVLYFFAPIAATFDGWTVMTGDESIRSRPVEHLLDALRQLECTAVQTRPLCNAPPIVIQGPMKSGLVVTEGTLSQYISGLMMAAPLMRGKTDIKLKNPKEVPYLQMTKDWLESVGIQVAATEGFKTISVHGPQKYQCFDRTIPSDWEGIAFPLVAAVITDSLVTIKNVDTSGSQGDAAIVDILKSMGADIELHEDNPKQKTGYLIVRGGYQSRLENRGRLHGVEVNCSGFPDAVPALAVAACFADGDTVLSDISVCRHKETDRIEIMAKELTELGGKVTEGVDFLVIHGTSKYADNFKLHGGSVESYKDHRVAMALAVLGLGLPERTDFMPEVIVNDAECCSISFPGFFQTMNAIGCNFRE